MTRIRSPNYPALSLNEAVGRIRVVYERELTHPAERRVIAEALGYSGLNGASVAIISSLAKYGLLEPAGADLFRVSPNAVDILEHPKGQPDRAAAIARMAFLPVLFEELQGQFGPKPPSDNNLRSYLVKRGFNPRTVGDVIRSYRDTLEFVDAEHAASAPSEASEVRSEMPTQHYNEAPNPAATQPRATSQPASTQPWGELVLAFKVAEDCEARAEFRGRVTQEAIKKLIAHLELSLDVFPKKEAATLESLLGQMGSRQE